MDRIEHGLLNMNMISKEKHDSLVASGYYKLTSSSGLLKIPSDVLDTFFDNPPANITLENFRALLPEGKDIYDYGDLCHKAIEKEMEKAKEIEKLKEKKRKKIISKEEMDTLKDMSAKEILLKKLTNLYSNYFRKNITLILKMMKMDIQFFKIIYFMLIIINLMFILLVKLKVLTTTLELF